MIIDPKGWFEALFGAFQSRGADLNLLGKINFLSPLYAEENEAEGRIDIGLAGEDLDVSAAVESALEPILGAPLPADGTFQAPLPISQSYEGSLYRAHLGVSLDATTAGGSTVADAGTRTYSLALPASKRCKITVQLDALGADATAYEMARRFIVHTAGSSIVATLDDYMIDAAIDVTAVDEDTWADVFTITAAPSEEEGEDLVLVFTVTNSSGQAAHISFSAQLEHRDQLPVF